MAENRVPIQADLGNGDSMTFTVPAGNLHFVPAGAESPWGRDLRLFREALDLPLLSPSAPYELEHKAREKAATWEAPPKWWTMYPEGQTAAAIFRLWHRLGMPSYCHDPEFRALLEAEA